MPGVLAFSLGLILLIVAGTELFTGNNLMAWVSFLSNLVGLVYHIIYRRKPGHV